MSRNYNDIAEEDMDIMVHLLEGKYYNMAARFLQQFAEKKLKYYIERYAPEDVDILRSHKINDLYNKLAEYVPLSELTIKDELYILTRVYFTVNYPSIETINLNHETFHKLYSKIRVKIYLVEKEIAEYERQRSITGRQSINAL